MGYLLQYMEEKENVKCKISARLSPILLQD